MKKFLLFIALCATGIAWGQERKLLSMEDAILNRDLIPQNYDIRFDKENPAIKQAALYSKQMLQILREMGLTTSSCRPPDDDGGGLG